MKVDVRKSWDAVRGFINARMTRLTAVGAIAAALSTVAVPTVNVNFTDAGEDAGITERLASYIPVITIKMDGNSAFAQNRPGTGGCNAPGGCTHHEPGPRARADASADARSSLKANFLSLGLNAAATAISQDGCTVTTGWGIGAGAYGFGLVFNKSELGENEQRFFVSCTHYHQLTDILAAMAQTNNCPGLVYAIEAMAITARDERSGRVLMQGNPALAALNRTDRGQGLLAGIATQCHGFRIAPPRK